MRAAVLLLVVALAGCEYRPVATGGGSLGPDLIPQADAPPAVEQTACENPDCPCGRLNCKCGPDCQCTSAEPPVEAKKKLIRLAAPDGRELAFHVVLIKPRFACPACDRWLRTVSFDLQRQGYKVGVQLDGHNFPLQPMFPAFRVASDDVVRFGSFTADRAVELLGDPADYE